MKKNISLVLIIVFMFSVFSPAVSSVSAKNRTNRIIVKTVFKIISERERHRQRERERERREQNEIRFRLEQNRIAIQMKAEREQYLREKRMEDLENYYALQERRDQLELERQQNQMIYIQPVPPNADKPVIYEGKVFKNITEFQLWLQAQKTASEAAPLPNR